MGGSLECRAKQGAFTGPACILLPIPAQASPSVTFIPAVWGRGSSPAHALDSIKRQLLLSARADAKLKLKPGHALQPVVWSLDPADPAAGVKALEGRWVGVWSAGPSREPSPVLPAFYFPSQPRPPPRARGLGAELALPDAMPRLAACTDGIDPAETCPTSSSLHSRAWQELLKPDIHRQATITAWRILHGSLMVGAFQHHVFKRADALACPHSSCSGCAATLTHTFLECTAVAPVIAYICAFWRVLDP